MEEKEIELKSEEIQAILSRPPRFLIRLGTSVIGLIILIVFVGSFFFYYPDIIQSDITITTENPPAWIIARSTGRIKDFYVKDKQQVKRGELIAVMENSAKTSDIFSVKELLSSVNLSDSVLRNIKLLSDVDLGTVQLSYSAFFKAVEDYKIFLILDVYGQKMTATKQQLKDYNSYISHLNNQVSISKKVVDITLKDHGREELLYKKGVSSISTFEESTKNCLSNKQSTEQLLTNVSSAKIESTKLRNSLAELSIQQKQEINQLKINLHSSYDDLMVAIKTWELNYLLCSPNDGIISYNDVWKENQNINTGEKVFSVIPISTGRIIGRVKIPINGSGKVKVGQRVNIRVNGYPYMEYGYLKGVVESISLLPNQDVYSAVIKMQQNLMTSYNKELSFKGELNGSAEIVTNDLSLAQRILYPIRYIFNRNFSVH